MTSPDGERWGSYLLESRLASGGMAEVFRARRLGVASFSKHVCVKRMHAHLCEDKSLVELFLDEARTGAKLRHRNIVTTEDLGEHEGRYFLALEYVHGVDLGTLLDRLLARGERIDIAVALYIAGEILAALDAAHRAIDPDDGTPLRVIHRDVSPRNVLVSFSGEVKLTDFGIARAANRRTRTASGVVRGKFGYMPPEQAQASNVDVRADLYALGVTLFELLAGKRPFCGDDPEAPIEAIVLAQAEDRRPRLASLRPDLSEAVCAFVEALFARSVGARPSDARVALEALHALPESHGGGLALGNLMARLFPTEASVAAHGSVTPPTPVRVSHDAAPVDPLAKTAAGTDPTDRARDVRASADSRPTTTTATRTLRTITLVLAAASVGAVGVVAFTRARAHESVASPSGHAAPPPAPTAPAPSIPAPVPTVTREITTPAPAPAPEAPRPSPPITIPSHPHGSIRVVAVPWGHVSIDGHPHGDAPVTVPVAAGVHTVVITGGVRHTERVHVASGQVRVINAGTQP